MNLFNQFLFYIKLPRGIKSINWKNTTNLIIGGRINRILENRISKAEKIIKVDISEAYINSKNILDIKADAHSLPMLDNESVDFVASSHTIEHLTNPLKALIEWRRILKKGGFIYACLPYYKKTFDHNRTLTDIKHIIDDYNNDVKLSDTTHDAEFIKKFDVKMDLYFNDYSTWYKNYLTNPSIYTHYHVFDKSILEKLMAEAGFETIAVFYNGISIEYFGVK